MLIARKASSQFGCLGCLYGPAVEDGYFLQTIRPMCCSVFCPLCDVVLILLSLMIWHSNCLDKRSRTVVVPHVNGFPQSIVHHLYNLYSEAVDNVHFGFFAITSELPDVEVLHCACVSGGFAVIEVDRSYYPIVQPSRIIGIVKKCTKCLVCERF
ncbi:Extracellular matrix regulatory protein [Trichinella spiralis]|uniref:Extracellular matrix regulatory protein n=1 Tax=Trichinella spiralis TaxID=6334 RepID=A0ABR3K1M5_TRISP